MAAKGLYDTVKQAIQDVVAPQIQELKGEISGLQGEMRYLEMRMEEGFGSVRTEMTSMRSELRTEISATRNELHTQIEYTQKRVEEALEIRERLAASEARVGSTHG